MKDQKEQTPQLPGEVKEFVLNDYCKGYSMVVDNCWNYSIYAQDPNISIFDNEFCAGFVQAKVQGKTAIKAARDNAWRNYLICNTPQEAISIEQTDLAMQVASDALLNNYRYFYNFLKEKGEERIPLYIKRLLFRMAGLWVGVNHDDFTGTLKFEDLDPDKIGIEEFKCGKYENQKLTFADIYFINAEMDLYDVISSKIGIDYDPSTPTKNVKQTGHCSAYALIRDNEIYWTHNSWDGMFDMSCAVTFCIGEDFVTQNSISQGQFGSNTDFGFNKNGIGFNETTELYTYNKPKELGIWLTWRAAAAEQFCTSIEDFYDFVSIDNTATYQNGYMIVDVNRKLIGLMEMSYDRFALFICDGNTIKIKDSTGYEPTVKDYDHHLITPTHIFGINQPVYKPIHYELGSMNARPMRRVQFFNHIDHVVDMDTCKDLITYTDDKEPLSIYGRWDLGFGTTELSWRVRPDGSLDGKAASASLVKEVLDNITLQPCIDGEATSFWMKYGTARINGRSFQWSQSYFKEFKGPQSEDYVPDVLDGNWHKVRMFMKSAKNDDTFFTGDSGVKLG